MLSDRLRAAWNALFDARAAETIKPIYLRRYPAKIVVQHSDKTVDVQPLSSDVPGETGLVLWTGVPGLSVDVAPGTFVELEYQEGSEQKPIACLARGDTAALNVTLSVTGSVTISGAAAVTLASGSVTDDAINCVGRVVRYGDPIVFSAPGQGTIVPGAVLNNFSKVRG